MMTLFLNKLHFPVTTLGYGRRVGIWFQGCSIRCPGCVSRDTWELARQDDAMEVDALVEQIAPWLAQADGVTVSGGEPFDQPEALLHLCRRLREAMSGDLLVYSGYASEKLTARHADCLALLDILISEPYQRTTAQTRWLRGSDNQRVHLLTPLARERYGANADTRPWPEQRRLDLMESNGDVWLAGIPSPGMLAELEDALARRGHGVAGTSAQTGPEATQAPPLTTTAAPIRA